MATIAVWIKVSVVTPLLLKDIQCFLLGVVCAWPPVLPKINDALVFIGQPAPEHWHLLNTVSAAIEPEGHNGNL